MQQHPTSEHSDSASTSESMAARVAAFDWASTPLGPMEQWPSTLRTAVGICLNSSFPMFVWWGPELIHIYNDAYAPIMGNRHPTGLGKSGRQVWAELWKQIEEDVDKVIIQGHPVFKRRERLILERNGYPEETFFTYAHSPIPDEQGKIAGLFQVCYDETAVVQAERARDQVTDELSEARTRMESTLRAAEVGTWTWDIANNRVVADRNLARMFGVSAEDAQHGLVQAYIAAIHPDDRTPVQAAIASSLGSGEPYECEYRLVSPNGNIRWVNARGKPELDANGKAARLPGMVLDITQRKMAEQTSRESEERYRTLFTSIDEGFCLIQMLYDQEGKPNDYRFLEVNPAFERHTTIIDAVGKTMRHFAPHHEASWFETYGEVDRSGTPVRFQNESQALGRWFDLYAFRVGDPGEHKIAVIFKDITQEKRTESALRESEAAFRQLADTMPQIVWTAQPDGTLDYYNQRWFDYIQLNPENLKDARWDRYIHLDDLPRAYDLWARSLRSGTPYNIEFRVKRSDGMFRWFLVRALAVRNATGAITRWFGTCTDIDDQKRNEEQLQSSESRYADILRTSLDAIVSMDHVGRVTDWNPAAEATFGFSREEAMGKEMASLIIPPAFRDMHRKGLTHYLATKEGPVLGKRIEVMAVHKSGIELPVELTITPAALANPPVFTAFIRDISARKRAESERERLLVSEREASTEAEHASKMKDEFLATLSHELRTPLNAILGWSQIMRGSKDPADMVEGLDIIDRNARAQAQIIEDLLDMSRIISGKVRLDVHRVDLAAIVQAAAETARPTADAKGIRLHSVIDPLHGVVVSGDSNRLQQIMWNLLSNAIKFTPKGGRVQVLLERVNSHLEVSVIDTGEGIKPDFLPFVFDRFRQQDASTTRRHGGLGLGLSIVKQLVELHGGSIRVKSAGAGEGSTFIVSLPLTVLQQESPSESERRHPRAFATTPNPSTINVEINGLRVLVVDDEADARSLVKRLLEDCDAIVVTAASADEAVAAMQKDQFDVLVSDIGMPGEDGYVLIHRIRAMDVDKGGNIPAIALTAYARAEDRVKAIVAGFQMHVAKPVEPIELITMVAGAAGRTGPRK